MIHRIVQEKRFYFYALLLLFLPMMVCFFVLKQKESALATKQARIERILQKASSLAPKKRIYSSFLERHQGADKDFVEKKLETLSFLTREKEKLQKVLSHPIFHDQALNKRFAFLNSKENRLEFTEQQPKKTPTCIESLLRQKKPIEVDLQDLLSLLHVVETSEEKKPQLLIKTFTLTKNPNDLFTVKMDLIKREFSQ